MPAHVVSVSYEPGDSEPAVMVYSLERGVRSNPDDRRATPRLSDLDRAYARSGQPALATTPTTFDANDHVAMRLTKMAAELGVVLPWYLANPAAIAEPAGS